MPIFLSEIADDEIRGTLISTLVVTETVGIVLGYIIGTYMDFRATPKFGIAITALFSLSLIFFPETSLFLLKQNKFTVS